MNSQRKQTIKAESESTKSWPPSVATFWEFPERNLILHLCLSLSQKEVLIFMTLGKWEGCVSILPLVHVRFMKACYFKVIFTDVPVPNFRSHDIVTFEPTVGI